MSVASVQARIAQIQSSVGAPAQSTAGATFNTHLAAAAQDTTALATTSTTAPTAAPAGLADIATAALSRPPALRGAAASTHVHNHGKVTPPAELVAYGNGKIPPTALAEIGEGEHRMWAPAAKSFQSLRQAAAADGVTIGVTDSYRSYEQQVDLAERKGLYSQGGLAATPGTSNHGWGMSLDLDLDSKAQSWMRANGEKYGFVEDVPREPWHWTYHGGAA
jgi:zinc D-Ala-D-Ala carboxypeptidase